MWYCRLELKAGRGGDGIISWARNRYNSRMGPSGGDGGAGGSIYLRVVPRYSDFSHLKVKRLQGKAGSNGMKFGKSGSAGADLYLELPPNTEVYELGRKIRRIILKEEVKPYLLCRGGRGGRGNQSFRNAKCQSPFLYELGEEGEKLSILLKKGDWNRIGVVFLSESGEGDWEQASELERRLKKDSLELFVFPYPIFEKEQLKSLYSEALELTHFILFWVESSTLNWRERLKTLKTELRKRGFKHFFTVLPEGENVENSHPNEIFFYLNKKKGLGELSLKLTEFSSSIEGGLPFFRPSIDEYSEYVEYSDELFPEKEPLSFSRVEGGWEVNSQRLSYWSSRIPQTTLHNIERLKSKFKLPEIMKEVKKLGGKEGEKLRIYSFETEIY